MRTNRKRHWGFGLIEILVTLGVLSVGIVGVTVLQGTVTKQSAENKSRAEALAIAQSRIEEMRNYTGDVDTLAEFNTLFANTSGYANSTAVTGTNATYTRDEQIGTSGELKTLTVRVTWSDSDNVSQTVNLSTQLSYVAPRSIGDTALEASASVVDAPTGRARLGDSTLPTNIELSSLAANSDGTYLYNQGTERMLVTQDREVVLTLEDACQTETGTCIDFVRIKGRVYIDRTSQGSLSPGGVFVIASDAAYCARYYTAANGTVTRVTRDTTSTITTGNGTNGSYTYFDYTCYLGGGWHGNIGILLAGGMSSSTKICIGDATKTLSTDDPFLKPVIAARRVYRGMLYKPVSSGGVYIQGDNNASVMVESYTKNGNTLPRYYSQGIRDSVVLPVPNSGQKTHDFVVGSFQQNLTDGTNCTTQGVMTRTDATVSGVSGGLFAGVPTDFVCLNDGLLDNYDSAYSKATACPYDPSDPPSSAIKISGTVKLSATNTTANTTIAQTMAAHTSDGPDNCTWTYGGHDGSYYNTTYICDAYIWSNGWTGYVEADYDASNMECSPYQLSKTAITTDSTGNNFANCTTGRYAVFTGTVSASGNRKLNTASMGANGTCTVLSGQLSYRCTSILYTGPTLTFTLTFTATSGYMCAPSTTYTDKAPGNYTQNLVIANNSNGC
jgi:Tfp pilus assembly protein PilV